MTSADVCAVLAPDRLIMTSADVCAVLAPDRLIIVLIAEVLIVLVSSAKIKID
jgi:hypothetical protein